MPMEWRVWPWKCWRCARCHNQTLSITGPTAEIKVNNLIMGRNIFKEFI